MNVLFLFLSFNGISDDRGMYGDLVLEFAKQHKVFVVAPLKGDGKTYLHREGNVNILWVRTMPLLNVGMMQKAIANMLLPRNFRSAVKSHLREKMDLIITPTPPITFCNLIVQLKREYNAKFFLILRDIFPQNAIDLKLMRKGAVYSYFRHQEKKLYDVADKIGCMSPGNVDYVKKHNPEIKKEKLVLLPNWLRIPEDIEKEESVVQKYGLKNKYVVLFGGNLGIAQQPENVLDLARLHKEKTDVVFLIIGKGILKRKIEEIIEHENLSNVRLVGHVSRSEYNAIARICKIGIVSLNENFTIPNIPSRTLGYWLVKLPVLAIVDGNTDYGKELLEKHEGGLWCTAGDKKSSIEKFNLLYKDDAMRTRMGMNGFMALSKYYNTNRAYQQIVESL